MEAVFTSCTLLAYVADCKECSLSSPYPAIALKRGISIRVRSDPRENTVQRVTFQVKSRRLIITMLSTPLDIDTGVSNYFNHVIDTIYTLSVYNSDYAIFEEPLRDVHWVICGIDGVNLIRNIVFSARALCK